jgi:hypothetical protein
MGISVEDTNVERLQTLCLRWNKAASAAGAIGSEYIDSPERVFETLAHHRRLDVGIAHRKGVLSIPLNQEVRTLADFADSGKAFKRPHHALVFAFMETSGFLKEFDIEEGNPTLARLTAEDLTATDWQEVTV